MNLLTNDEPFLSDQELAYRLAKAARYCSTIPVRTPWIGAWWRCKANELTAFSRRVPDGEAA